jgi:hypothetical protein
MMAIDTGMCAPESLDTLVLQQDQLIRGVRDAQMFPRGTVELKIPEECERYENSRGIFHFRNIGLERIKELSEQGRENEILMLGPFSKFDIALRFAKGEKITYITEYVSSIELRCAIGTNKTIDQQYRYFMETKESNGSVIVGQYPDRVKRWLEGAKYA